MRLRTTVPFAGPVIETGTWTRRIIAVLFAASVAFLIYQGIVSVFEALRTATSFSGYALDGAFQLYNPLRRMAMGEIPGRDFPFFHGVGMPWLHFPFYLLFGSNIFASELARWLLSPFFFALSGLLFFRAMLGTWVRATIALAPFVGMSAVGMFNLVDPGNSMVGIRSMTPLLIAAALMWTVRRHRVLFGFLQWHTSLLIAYALLGVAVALGTEQGVAAIGAFLLVRAVLNLRRLGWGWRVFVQIAVDVVAAVASTLIVLTALTFGHAIDALRYALVEIPSDQGWVFGSIPNIVLTPEAFFWELRGGASLDLGGVVPGFLMAALAAVILLVCARLAGAIGPKVVAVSVFLWIYGVAVLAALVGYISLAVQLAPFGRASAAIACGAGVALALTLIARAEARLRRDRVPTARRRAAGWGMGVAALAIVVVGATLAASSLPARAEILSAIPKREVISEALRAPGESDYEVAGPGYKQALDAFLPLIPEGSQIWATYTSLYSSERGVVTPAPGGEDYIIHALGKERRAAYEEAFAADKPGAVITTNPRYTIYEEWLWGRYPDFYLTLLENYTLTAENGSHVLWLRNEDPAPPESAPTEVPVAADGSFDLPGNDTQRVVYYELSVNYRADGGDIPVVSRLPRYYLRFDGSALALYGEVLPDDETTWNLVVPVFPGSQGVHVTNFIDGIHPLASLTIDGARYRQMSVPQENDQLIEQNFCAMKGSDERCAD
ncbi:hypothetical protein GCM10009862_03040 [Microbacterium binotii]|uniref:YfhO family protein n=2 Tax=Microbacterium binotii TaxID=462710 RepID=A0ABN3P7Y1_9MICO